MLSETPDFRDDISFNKTTHFINRKGGSCETKNVQTQLYTVHPQCLQWVFLWILQFISVRINSFII